MSRSADAYNWLIEAGIRIPEDWAAFACMNVNPTLGIAGASTMHTDTGQAAVDLITQMYENHWGIPPIRHALALDPIWIDGPTL